MFEHQHLLQIPKELLAPGRTDHRYDDSPFRALKLLGIRVKGARMEEIVEFLAKSMGQQVESAHNRNHDRMIVGSKIEIKGATLGIDTDEFTFNQIRPPQDYELLMLAMFYPHHIILMEMPKSRVLELVAERIFKAQHGGNDGNSGTFSYTGNEFTLAKLGATEVAWSQGTKSFNYGRGVDARFVSIPLF